MKCTIREDQFTFFTISRSVLLITRNVSDRAVEKIKTHILCIVTSFRKSYRLGDNVEKYCWNRQATEGNMVNGHFNLDNEGYSHMQCVTLTAYSLQQLFTNRPQNNNILTLSVLLT